MRKWLFGLKRFKALIPDNLFKNIYDMLAQGEGLVNC